MDLQNLLDLEFLKKALPVLFFINVGLSALSALLSKFMDLTESKVDNTIFLIVNKLSGLLQKALDMLGYNPKHKEGQKDEQGKV